MINLLIMITICGFLYWKGWLKLTPVGTGQAAFQLTLFPGSKHEQE